MTVIKNGFLLDENFNFVKQDIKFDDKIDSIGPNESQNFIDAEGLFVVPGLIDIHIHGAKGCDFCDGKIASLQVISQYLAQNGITSFLGTSMTLPEEELVNIFNVALDFIKESPSYSYMHGINMEGPYFSKQKKGAQAADHLKNPDIAMFQRLYQASGDKIKICSIAPELDGSADFIKTAKDKTVVSLAHTSADYDTASAAIDWGAKSVTHLYNAMPAYNHRKPGVIGAVFDSDIYAELICDGLHVHPAVIRNSFRTLGQDRIVLVSDSMSACGMEDGSYQLGGQPVVVKNSTATLADGTIAGSTTNLMKCVKNCIDFGIAMETAIKCATINPAKLIGVDDLTGSLKVGKNADLLVVDGNLDIKHVFVKGKQVI